MSKFQKKGIKFDEYVDREVPYIRNNAFADQSATGGDPRDFDTRFNNNSGLFSKMAENAKLKASKQGNEAVGYIQAKTKGKKGMEGIGEEGERKKGEMPDFLRGGNQGSMA